MAKRVFNFNPGPCALPLEVLEKVQSEFLDYQGTGMSIIESSQRSAQYEESNNAAIALVKELLGLGDNYKVLFVGGGASLQFAMVPMNFLREGQVAAYCDTGAWANKAIKEAKLFGKTEVIFSSKEEGYKRVPKPADLKLPAGCAYLHVTSNNTIWGSQYHAFPDTGNVPLVCDMSSDIASRRLDFTKFSLIYAGAQKNLGPAGVTLVIIRDDFLGKAKEGLSTMLSYLTHAKELSLYNTPPVFGVYIMRLVLEWVKKQGGLKAVEKVNEAKKNCIYGVMDKYPDYFKGPIDKDSRSWMNLTLRLPNEELEKKFIAEAKAAGFVGLKGHRSVGGIRVSLYNAVPLEAAEKLAQFMEAFKKAN